ncbi:hypothetical protein L593_03495 [Salinarchaeum sp. Harcht-Bsk1]|uniref:hypothetical protein n=1 Tax=Salinarchaeum sp. Harcht-Bsk1 TaxID=1333523 RepID=UPI0003424167|nr:hypothetical protein [Salinarchaeum sp. Harcht-Bsk1]AGN00650.1 hypothetical protein L593_03495 [Salinarchaeum sp. Harcht-Bsk1]
MTTTTNPGPLHRVLAGLQHRARVLLLVATRWRPLAVLVVGTLAYLLAFLYAMGDLEFEAAGWGITTVAEPWQRMLEPGPGPYTHEPIALVEFSAGQLLFSPLNTLLGLGLAVLVGTNLALSFLAITQPKSCGVGAGTGLAAAIPALLGGSACCAPTLLIVLGIQAGSLLVGLLAWLLPIGATLLVVTLVYVAGRVDSAALRGASSG